MNSIRFIVAIVLTVSIYTKIAHGKEVLDIHRILRTGQNKAKCSANPACNALQLAGDCCPTKAGVTLDCCKVKSVKCKNNAACAALDLTGDCCPTKDDALLDCCNYQSTKCSATAACKNLGLGGDCCPTKDDVFLDCCKA